VTELAFKKQVSDLRIKIKQKKEKQQQCYHFWPWQMDPFTIGWQSKNGYMQHTQKTTYSEQYIRNPKNPAFELAITQLNSTTMKPPT
jgi:hypothetical protein